jgi:hypothetical protein
MIMYYDKGAKPDQRWKATITPAYESLVLVYPFLEQAEEAFRLEPGPGLMHDEQSLYGAAAIIADEMLLEAIKRDRLREKIQHFADAEILGYLAGELDLAIEPGARGDTEQGLLAAMCARDLERYWITPHWRVQLSYRQLVQSRIWTKAVEDPAWQPLLKDLCALEAEIKHLSTEYIEGELFPRYITPMIERGVSALTAAGSELPGPVLQSVMMLALVNVLAERIAIPIEARYNNNPNMQRILPDNLQGSKQVHWFIL